MLDHIAGNADREMAAILQKNFREKGHRLPPEQPGHRASATARSNFTEQRRNEDRRRRQDAAVSVGRRAGHPGLRPGEPRCLCRTRPDRHRRPGPDQCARRLCGRRCQRCLDAGPCGLSRSRSGCQHDSRQERQDALPGDAVSPLHQPGNGLCRRNRRDLPRPRVSNYQES